ncbi:MAG: TraB/GumN family protein [Burkholderiaceae bacterium]
MTDMLQPVTVGETATRPASDERRRWLGSAIAGVASTLNGCASVNWFEVQAPGNQGYHPALYRLNGSAGYPGAGWLLGAIHAGQTDLFPLPEPVMTRFYAADTLAVELNVNRRRAELHAAFSARALLPNSGKINDWVSEPTIRWLQKRFSITDTRWPALSRLQPWALTRALHGTDRSDNPGSVVSVEQHLLLLASQKDKAVMELERPIEQIEALAGGSLRWQAQLLEFRVTDKRFWDNTVPSLIRAWRRGDQTRLLAIKNAAFGADPLLADLRERMFDGRDRLMAQRLSQLLREPRKVFATVGAFHLVGRNNLRTELQQLGITVERIDYHSEIS